MVYVAVDKDGTEVIFNDKPVRGTNNLKGNCNQWALNSVTSKYIVLSKGSIEKLIGRTLTWDDEPVEI